MGSYQQHRRTRATPSHNPDHQPYYQQPYYRQSYNPYMHYTYSHQTYTDSDNESVTSVTSTDSTITIVPSQRSDHDGYHRFKTPSGQVARTAGGQTIELFAV